MKKMRKMEKMGNMKKWGKWRKWGKWAKWGKWRKYLQVEKSVYFMDYEIYSVEVPVKDHGKPEIVEAKNKEIENLKFYETYEEVRDEGQETIGSRWVVTEKQQHDGQKQDYKARLIAKGFQELDQPQSDSPAAAKESFKLMMALLFC